MGVASTTSTPCGGSSVGVEPDPGEGGLPGPESGEDGDGEGDCNRTLLGMGVEARPPTTTLGGTGRGWGEGAGCVRSTVGAGGGAGAGAGAAAALDVGAGAEVAGSSLESVPSLLSFCLPSGPLGGTEGDDLGASASGSAHDAGKATGGRGLAAESGATGVGAPAAFFLAACLVLGACAGPSFGSVGSVGGASGERSRDPPSLVLPPRRSARRSSAACIWRSMRESVVSLSTPPLVVGPGWDRAAPLGGTEAAPSRRRRSSPMADGEGDGEAPWSCEGTFDVGVDVVGSMLEDERGRLDIRR